MNTATIASKIGLALLLAGNITTATGSPITQYEGHSYTLTSLETNWTDAEAEAVLLGGHLVTINNEQEQNFLVSTYLSGNDATTKRYWIGLNDQAIEGTFIWASGQPVTYTNWHPGEPNNQNNEDYVQMNWHLGQGGQVGDWNDAPNEGVANTKLYGIVETNQTPEPGTIYLLLVGAIYAMHKKRTNQNI